MLALYSTLCFAISGSSALKTGEETTGDETKIILVTYVAQDNIFRQLVYRPNNGGVLGAVFNRRKIQRGMPPYQEMLKDYNVRNSIHQSLVRELSENGYDVVESHQKTEFSTKGFSKEDYLSGKEGVGLIYVSFDYYFGPFLNTITVNGHLESYVEKKRKKNTSKRKYSKKKSSVHYQLPRRIVKFVPLNEKEVKNMISEIYDLYDVELKLAKKGSEKIRLRKKRDKEIWSLKRKYAKKSDTYIARDPWSKENLLSEIGKGFNASVAMLVNGIKKLNAKERFYGEDKMPYTTHTHQGHVVGMAIKAVKLTTPEDNTHDVFVAKKNTVYIVPKGEVFQC
ncbi:MAG: hypothetical protein K6L80_09695 [Agarilytica sp.]